MATGGGKQPTFRTAQAQRTVRPEYAKVARVTHHEGTLLTAAGGTGDWLLNPIALYSKLILKPSDAKKEMFPKISIIQ